MQIKSTLVNERQNTNISPKLLLQEHVEKLEAQPKSQSTHSLPEVWRRPQSPTQPLPKISFCGPQCMLSSPSHGL